MNPTPVCACIDRLVGYPQELTASISLLCLGPNLIRPGRNNWLAPIGLG